MQRTLLTALLLLLLVGCQRQVTPSIPGTPQPTPEQNAAAYISVVCGSETTKGANLEVTKAALQADQLQLIDKPTTREILNWTERVGGFCRNVQPILTSPAPWPAKAPQIVAAVEKVGPPGWLQRLIPNTNIYVQSVVTTAQTVVAMVKLIQGVQ